jgi:hypothetical protein
MPFVIASGERDSSLSTHDISFIVVIPSEPAKTRNFFNLLLESMYRLPRFYLRSVHTLNQQWLPEAFTIQSLSNIVLEKVYLFILVSFYL